MSAGDFSKDDTRLFDAKDPKLRFRLWVRVSEGAEIYRYFFWRRILKLCAVLLVVGWLATAGAAWAFVKYRRGYDGVRFHHLALYPFFHRQHLTGLGRHYIAQGRIELEKKNYRTAYQLLMAGIARAPADIESRRLVAFTQIRLGRTDLALQTLSDGAVFALDNLDYQKLLFGFLLETHDDEQVVALARRLLPSHPTTTLVHQFIAVQLATAHFQRGRYDDAERIIADWKLENALEAQVLLARCDWERGYRDLALARLERQIARFPNRDEVYLELVRCQRELGHVGEMRRYALLRQFNDPASPGPRIDLLHGYRLTGDTTAHERELATYLATFGADPKALLLLAWFAIDTAQPAVAQRVFETAREKEFPLSPFALARVQAALAVHDYRGALEFADAALAAADANNERLTSFLNGLRAIALIGLQDLRSGELLIESFLGRESLRMADALLLARLLRDLDVPKSARRILERAAAVDSLNQAALSELIRLDADAGNRAALLENVPKLLQLRKPSRVALEAALPHLSDPTDAPLRDRIRAALAPGGAPSTNL